MLRERSTVRRLAASLILGPALLLLALIAPASIAAAGPITSTACSPTGATAVTCDLWAKTGTLILPGGSTPIWGFAATSGGTASVPGPVLIVNSGDSVTVNLTNQLTATTAILFEGQPMVPDLTGVAAGGTKTYTFTAGAPGTYLYEAGLLPGTQYQSAKGLYGALIVRPAGGLMQANNSAATAFDDEALVVLGEVDTALNNSGSPASFDLRGYAPRYFLINGQAYPDTTAITTTGGKTLLLRYIDAGLQHHSMGVLGLRQTVVNDDGSALANPRHMTAESLAPGQATDVLLDIPTSAATSTKYLVYDASLGLNNTTGTGANAGIGGMLTIIDAAGTAAGGDTVGPVTSGVTIDATTGALAGSATDASTGGASVAGAEYFIDSTGAPTTGTAMTGAFPSDPAALSGTVAVGSLSSGTHTVYVHARDGLGNWGTFSSVTFSLDSVGPATTGLVLTPAAANGTADVSLTGTADDRPTGSSNIMAAEYFIDAFGANGAGTPMTLSTTAAPVSSLSATIPAATINALAAGGHPIFVHSQDALGAWGSLTLISLAVDKAGPTTSAVSAAPNPNNGTLGINSTNPSVRVQATFDDASPAFVQRAEAFIDVLGPVGTGLLLPPSDGLYNTAHELGYTDIPLTSIAPLSAGNHTIYVRGRDSVGNWGPAATTILVIDKSGPSSSGATLSRTAANNQAVTVTAIGSDVATGNQNVVGGELFIDTSAANGTGRAMTAAAPAPTATITGTIPAATVAGLSVGNHTIYIHARDAAGNWGARITITLRIDRTAPTFSSITLTPSTIASGTASVGLTVNGASDGGGSGVAGGEFWIANSNVPPGGGTAFTGLTATVPTASLVPGTYTVRTRIRDNAGNWSTGTNGVRTRTLTVTGPAPVTIFSDGFELKTTPGTWISASTSSPTRIAVTAAAALAGNLGLQAQGNNKNYVQYSFATAASPATAIYDARFSFRPNAKATKGHDIFVGATSSRTFAAPLFRIRYRLQSGKPQVQIQLASSNGNAKWTTIKGGRSVNAIEVVWQAARSGGPQAGTLRLYVNGSLKQSLRTTSVKAVGAVRLGVVTSGGGSARVEFFDAFASRRSATPYGS